MLLNVLNVVTLVAKVYASQRNLVCKTIYRIARKFRGVKFSWKLIRLSFRNSDSDPIAIINDVNIVSRIKIFVDGDKSTKTAKILHCETFQLYGILVRGRGLGMKVVALTALPSPLCL